MIACGFMKLRVTACDYYVSACECVRMPVTPFSDVEAARDMRDRDLAPALSPTRPTAGARGSYRRQSGETSGFADFVTKRWRGPNISDQSYGSEQRRAFEGDDKTPVSWPRRSRHGNRNRERIGQ
eukprot:6213965-Pleurochrysis_carterae.AAC.3